MAEIQIYLSPNSRAQAVPYDHKGNHLPALPFGQSPLLIKKGDNPLRALVLMGDFNILKLCMLTVEESDRIKQQLEHLQYIKETLSEEWKSQNIPLFDPQCYYRVSVVTQTELKNSESEELTLIEVNVNESLPYQVKLGEKYGPKYHVKRHSKTQMHQLLGMHA